MSESIHDRRCGRLTRAGTPCKQVPLHNYGKVGFSPCRQHMTEVEREDAALKWLIYCHGMETARKSSEEYTKMLRERIDKLERKIENREIKENTRFDDGSGRQLVTIDYKLGYAWAGDEPLAAGDKVLLPGNWVHPHAWIGEVTSLGSTWKGDFSQILKRE